MAGSLPRGIELNTRKKQIKKRRKHLHQSTRPYRKTLNINLKSYFQFNGISAKVEMIQCAHSSPVNIPGAFINSGILSRREFIRTNKFIFNFPRCRYSELDFQIGGLLIDCICQVLLRIQGVLKNISTNLGTDRISKIITICSYEPWTYLFPFSRYRVLKITFQNLVSDLSSTKFDRMI